MTLPESQKPPQTKRANECRRNSDNNFGVNCTQEEQNNCLFNRRKQSVANSVGETKFPNNHTQLEVENESILEDPP